MNSVDIIQTTMYTIRKNYSKFSYTVVRKL